MREGEPLLVCRPRRRKSWNYAGPELLNETNSGSANLKIVVKAVLGDLKGLGKIPEEKRSIACTWPGAESLILKKAVQLSVIWMFFL